MAKDYFTDANWERCSGMNSKAHKCLAGRRHLGHRKHWLTQVWYGQTPYRDAPKLYGKNKPRPKK